MINRYIHKIEIFKEVIQLGKDKKKKKKSVGMEDIIEAAIQEGMKKGIEEGLKQGMKDGVPEGLQQEILEGLKEEGFYLEEDKESEKKDE